MKTRLEIFKAGTHVAENGRKYEFSEADVSQMAAVYDPALSRAPYVLGHPKTDAPAWGWSGKLEAEGGRLFVIGEQVEPAFAEAVDAGRYTNRSAAFYAPNDPANPKPGSWYLRHVGWLGAKAPSIKGMEAAFSEDAGAEFVTFGQADGFWTKDIFRNIRDLFIEKWGLEQADKTLPAYAIDNIDREIAPAFAELSGVTDPDPAAEAAALERAAELDRREAALAEREAAAAERERVAFAEAAATTHATNRSADAAFVDQLVTDGKLPPAQADRVKTLFGVLGGDETVAFAEGEPQGRDQLRELLSGLGQAIHFGEFAPAEGARFAEERTPEDHAAEIARVRQEAAGRGEALSVSAAASRLS